MRNTDKRVDRLFRLAAHDAADQVHLLLGDTGQTATYAETYQRAQRMAAVLVNGGVKRGDRVACLMGNSRELVEFYIACGLCGAIAVALNTLSTSREVQRIFEDCTPTAVVAQPRYAKVLSDTQ